MPPNPEFKGLRPAPAHHNKNLSSMIPIQETILTFNLAFTVLVQIFKILLSIPSKII